jgi:succinate dehydrogenase/fumarate reductase flavoprotein subunit
MTDIDGRFDLVVAGGGLAGITAAAAVARRGGRVLVLEKTAQIGGASLMSGGMVWTAKDPEFLIRECPEADPDLIRVLRAEFPRLIDWFRAFGVEVDEEAEVLLRHWSPSRPRDVLPAGGRRCRRRRRTCRHEGADVLADARRGFARRRGGIT